MKLKFGAIIVDGSGKIGGQVVSSNRGGKYLRTKVTPSNPQTVSQQNARALLSSLSTAWAELTDAQRLSWNGAVSSYASTDIFGDIKNPSGFNLFVKLNANLANVGEASLLVAPEKEEVPYSAILTAVFDISSTTGEITFNDSAFAGRNLLVSATPTVSAGRSNVKNQFRVIGSFQPVTDSIDVWAEYVAKFGVPTAGANISIKIEPVVSSGQKGTGQTTKVSVVA